MRPRARHLRSQPANLTPCAAYMSCPCHVEIILAPIAEKVIKEAEPENLNKKQRAIRSFSLRSGSKSI